MNRFTRTAAACMALALGGTGLAGCDFTEGNDVDPNAATSATADLLLNGGEVGQIILQEGDAARYAGVFAGYFTGSDRQFAAFEEGRQNSDDFNSLWSNAYQETLAQLDLAREAYEASGNRVGAGIAKVHMALAYGTLADLFGAVPFSEALDAEQFENPAFDSQADVYAGAIAMLESAIADLQSLQGTISPAAEIFYGSQFYGTTTNATNAAPVIAARYVAVANSLLGRYHLNLQNYAAAEAAAENGISSFAGNMVAPHGSSLGSNVNQYYEFGAVDRVGYLTANDAFAVGLFGESETLTDETARRAFYYTGPLATANLNYNGFFAFNGGFPIVTYAENQLVLAEARLLSDGDQAGALAALNEYRASLEARFGNGEGAPEYPAFQLSDFAAGGALNNGTDSQGDALLREILEEKYLSLIGSVQGFTDVRRTDNFIGVSGKDNGRIPQRFIYPRNEINSNTSTPNPTPAGDVELPVFAAFDYTGAD